MPCLSLIATPHYRCNQVLERIRPRAGIANHIFDRLFPASARSLLKARSRGVLHTSEPFSTDTLSKILLLLTEPASLGSFTCAIIPSAAIQHHFDIM